MAGNHGGGGIDERVAQQDDADQPVDLGQQGLGEDGASMALSRQQTQTVAVVGHHGRFGHGEETGQNQQHGQSRELGG